MYHQTRFAMRAVIFERRYPCPFGQAVFKFRFARAATFVAIISAWPLLRWVSGGIGKNPELFHAANSMLYADAQLCVPCVVAFPLFGKGMVP